MFNTILSYANMVTRIDFFSITKYKSIIDSCDFHSSETFNALKLIAEIEVSPDEIFNVLHIKIHSNAIRMPELK